MGISVTPYGELLSVMKDISPVEFTSRIEWCLKNTSKNWMASYWAYSGGKDWWKHQHENNYPCLVYMNDDEEVSHFLFTNKDDAMKFKLIWGQMRYCYDDTHYSKGNIRTVLRHLVYIPPNSGVIEKVFDIWLENDLLYLSREVYSWLNENYNRSWSYERDEPYGITLMFKSKDDAMRFKLTWEGK